ncbi:Rpn family recombination-promoting nuclease/putative transposase [Bacillus cereus]|uniref:hypothetical protein n=1 Tax=Bacillus cereus TaxID=1396 RepID=UPI003078B521
MGKNTESTNVKRVPYDGLFKTFLKEPILLKHFLNFAGREDIVKIIDFEEEIIPLDTDNNTIYVITDKEKKEKRYADVILLVKTIDVNGKKGEIILHFEPQSFRDPEFPYRMYTYNKRIEVLYEKDAMSFAICFKDYPQKSENMYTKEYYYGEQKTTFLYNQIHLKKYKRDDYKETSNLAEISLCGLMNKERRGINNLELYKNCLDNLDNVNKSGMIEKNKDIVFTIILSCLYHFIKLDNASEKKEVKDKIKMVTEGDEGLMNMLTTIFHEEVKIDVLVNFATRKLRGMSNNEELINHLREYLENADGENEINQIEDELFDCNTPQDIVTKIKSLKLKAGV